MKTLIAALFLFCGIISPLCAEAEFIPCAKTYVSPSQIHFTESSLLIQVGEDIWVQPAAIHIDENGLYFKALQPTPGPWQCQRAGCLYWNRAYFTHCQQCGAVRGAK